jgi:hypothetical protein
MKFKSILSLSIYYLLLMSGALVFLSITSASISTLLNTKHQLAAHGAEQYSIIVLLVSLIREIIPANIGFDLSITLPIITSMGNRIIRKNLDNQREPFVFYDYVNIMIVASLLLLLGILTGFIISCIYTVTKLSIIKFSFIFKQLDATDILPLILKTFVFSSLLFLIHKFQFSLLGKKKGKAKKIAIMFGTIIVGFLGVLISDVILTKIFFSLNI